jgi:hypothetical protein
MHLQPLIETTPNIPLSMRELTPARQVLIDFPRSGAGYMAASSALSRLAVHLDEDSHHVQMLARVHGTHVDAMSPLAAGAESFAYNITVGPMEPQAWRRFARAVLQPLALHGVDVSIDGLRTAA